MEIGLEQPEGLRTVLSRVNWRRADPPRGVPYQKRAVDRLLAQVDYELLQGHRLIVYADEEVT